MSADPVGLKALLRHPLHPIVAHFPLALLLAATVAQLWDVIGGDEFTHRLAVVLLSAGLLMSLPAIAAGGYDAWKHIYQRQLTSAYRLVSAHVMCMTTALMMFVVSLICLLKGQVNVALISSLLGALSIVIGGFFGGSMVYLLGVGVHKE